MTSNDLVNFQMKPVWDGYLADPFVLRHETPSGPEFYAYGTGSNVGDVCSGNRHFPLLRSRNLQSWEHLGGALAPAPELERKAHWAPEVCERDGTWYFFYSAFCNGPSGHETQRLRLATAPRPSGPFEDSGELLFPDTTKEDGDFCIDASPLRDPQSGEWYLFFSRDRLDDERPGTGTAVVRLDERMRPVGEVLVPYKRPRSSGRRAGPCFGWGTRTRT
jgi:arabinan endo-1,5-alpha-L-arabinosidase